MQQAVPQAPPGEPINADTRARAGAAVLIAADIKLAHSVFALPFAVLAVFLAARPGGDGWAGWPTLWGKLSLVVVCMVAARTWAMLVNRLADRDIDAQNQRTSRRVFASGALPVRTGVAALALSALVFAAGAGLFWPLFGNPWPLMLCAPVLAWIGLYSFTKRFTALCHVFLGGALAASPLAAAIAIDPDSLARTPSLWCISGFVLLWVAGFDIIYALQDEEFDRGRGLHSIPAALGWARAVWVSRAMHAGAFALLVLSWRLEPAFGLVFACAGALVAALLVAEHVVLARRGRAGIPMAFFTLNGVVSCLLGALGSFDVLMP